MFNPQELEQCQWGACTRNEETSDAEIFSVLHSLEQISSDDTDSTVTVTPNEALAEQYTGSTATVVPEEASAENTGLTSVAVPKEALASCTSTSWEKALKRSSLDGKSLVIPDAEESAITEERSRGATVAVKPTTPAKSSSDTTGETRPKALEIATEAEEQRPGNVAHEFRSGRKTGEAVEKGHSALVANDTAPPLPKCGTHARTRAHEHAPMRPRTQKARASQGKQGPCSTEGPHAISGPPAEGRPPVQPPALRQHALRATIVAADRASEQSLCSAK